MIGCQRGLHEYVKGADAIPGCPECRKEREQATYLRKREEILRKSAERYANAGAEDSKRSSKANPEHYIWMGMRSRCNNAKNKDYAKYGGRGIKVCDEWNDRKTGFERFLADMGRRPSPKHSIDRKENSGNYEPSNCWWTTALWQNRNRRNSALVTYLGQTKCLKEWSQELDLNYRMLIKRIGDMGWSVERAMTTPVLTREQCGKLSQASSKRKR